MTEERRPPPPAPNADAGDAALHAQLQALHAGWLQSPVPDAQRAAAQRLQERLDRQRGWRLWGGMAAGWVLAFGLGWLVHGQWPTAAMPAAGLAARAGAPQRFAQQAAVAHAVYQPEKRHPVEVTAAQQDHLVQWLSRRLGRPLTVPALDADGFALVGGRLLPGGTGARAQFMYEDAQGVRVTLYLGALEAQQEQPQPRQSQPQATRPAAQETAFRFQVQDDGVASFYWVDQGFGYALSGQMPRGRLLALATAVHRQL